MTYAMIFQLKYSIQSVKGKQKNALCAHPEESSEHLLLNFRHSLCFWISDIVTHRRKITTLNFHRSGETIVPFMNNKNIVRIELLPDPDGSLVKSFRSNNSLRLSSHPPTQPVYLSSWMTQSSATNKTSYVHTGLIQQSQWFLWSLSNNINVTLLTLQVNFTIKNYCMISVRELLHDIHLAQRNVEFW